MTEPMHGDPLLRPPVALGRRIGIGAALIGAAVVLHVVATAGISGASWVIGLGGDIVAVDDEPVEVAIVDTPDPAPEPAPDVVEPEPGPTPQSDPIEPEPTPDPTTDPDPDPKPKRAKPARDPNPPETPAQPNAPQPPRVVGLELESTVTGGDGPAYATGNTRTGKTSRTAVDPRSVGRRSAPPPPTPPAPPAANPNRTASDIPGSKVVVVKPKRVRKVKPDYPELLRARGIEGTVVVRVTIDERGVVTTVDIVAGSSHDELDRAAREAALREQFTPATRNGAPVEFSLTFSYHFRLSDA